MDRTKFQSIQSLRFFAAFLVVLAHIEERLKWFGERFGYTYRPIGFFNSVGVDIFFVISGFIMAWLAMDRFGQYGAFRQFVADRITRIAPLYWICTAAAALLSVVASHFGDSQSAGIPTWPELLKSCLFVPYLNSEGKHRPVLGQGWTLDYEMMFYVVLATCLFLRRRPGFLAVFAAFGLVFVMGQIPDAPAFLRIWANPIIFEFLAGVCLALIRLTFGELLHFRAHPFVLLIPIAVFTALCHWHLDSSPLSAIFGVLLVGLCVFGREQGSDVISNITARMGDWSYSLYLTHAFVLLLVGIAWRKLFAADHLWAYVVVIVAASLLLSYLSFTYVERPVTKLLRRLYGVRSVREPLTAAS